MIKAGLHFLFWLVLLTLNWVVYSYHAGVFPPPRISELEIAGNGSGRFIEKTQFGIHQLILSGTSFERGLRAGELTEKLLFKQENELVGKLKYWIPNRLALQGLILLAMDWFDGIEPYFEPWMTEEMYGVSRSAPKQFDDLADGFTRQIAYHGLHEVGQMTVDQKGDDMGCTVVATRYKDNWILGRNFDFEGGRVFDEDKVMKWVFPNRGNAYVSVIWAGMVGAVTGVNERGLYISINAAGSTDFRRYGTPSTLVLLKALQFANTAEEALAIFKTEQMFITDIFVMLDAKSGQIYRIEKSPRHTEVTKLTSPVIVTNHLYAERWKSDSINLFRKLELTSETRETRGRRLVSQLDQKSLKDPVQLEAGVLAILRDKGEEDGHPLQLGNRRAIDALIAAHSVVYNAADGILFVSQGPSLAGAFTGFDLKASFATRQPTVARTLPRDPLVSDQTYAAVHQSAQEVALADQALKSHDCARAKTHLDQAARLFQEKNEYYSALGDLYQCQGDLTSARTAWQKALSLLPAYARQIRTLKEKLVQ